MKIISKSHTIITVISLSVVVVLALMMTSRIGKENHLLVTQQHIIALRSLSSGFRELVISLRHGMTYNYDTANSIEQSITDHQKGLSEIIESLPEQNKQIKTYLDSSSQRREHWEQFKFHNAVVRNSMRYFQTGLPQFLEYAHSSNLPVTVSEQISALNTAVLLFALGERRDKNHELLSTLARIGTHLIKANKKLRSEYTLLERHVHTIIKHVPKVEAAMIALVHSSEREQLNLLENSNNAIIAEERRQASLYRSVLLLSATLLLLGVIFMAARYLESQRKAAQRMVFLKSVTDTLSVGVIAVDNDDKIIFSNPCMKEILSSVQGELIGTKFHTAGFHVDADGKAIPASESDIFQIKQHGEAVHNIYYLHSNDGRIIPTEVNVSPLKLGSGSGSVAVFQDVTQRMEEEKDLRLAGAVFENSQQGIIVTDSTGTIIQVNPAYCTITGYEEKELIGENPRILNSGLQDKKFYFKMWRDLNKHGSWNGELYNRRKNGEHYVQWANIDAVRTDQGDILYIGIASDITELVDARERLSKLAYYDTLTKLPNRVLFHDRISQTIAQAKRDDTGFALILADLDDFKAVNDTMGHAIGDKLLIKVAERLQQATRESDTVARLGGDEFAVILTQADKPQQVATISSHILDSLSQPYKINGLEITSSVSLGVTFWPIDGDSIDELLKNADVAMYRAKEYGRNNYQFFTSDMAENVVNALRIENGLRYALDNNELSLYYQPQIDPSGKAVSAEALMRWNSKDLGWVPPSQFIPVAERSGLIVQLEAFALREACKQCAEWRRILTPDFRIAVNISAAQFRHEGLISNVTGALHEFNLPGSALELEITESVVMDDVVRGQAVIGDLKRVVGCSLAIDDFGTGYSSLAYLNQFKVDVLKIDKTFVDGLGIEDDDTSVAEAIVSLAKSLDMIVVAEGVEKSIQLEAIKNITNFTGYLTQGFFFSPPIPAEDFEKKYPKFNKLKLVGDD